MLNAAAQLCRVIWIFPGIFWNVLRLSGTGYVLKAVNLVL